MPKQNGTEVTSISFRSDVLEALDEYSSRTDINRSDIVNQAVKFFLTAKDDQYQSWLDYKRRRLHKS
ncbi:MAG: ribbon-helix-helix domain-containing protein [Nanoarchaeota archaeon]|nr:ribbon-helix-helix domain-containing protein [Nanoarchaeota archaeon]